MKQLDDRTIIVGPVRLSYLNAFAPRMNEQKKQNQYSAVLLIPKQPNDKLTDPQGEVKAIADAIKATMKSKFGENFKGLWKNPLKDGDKELKQSDGEPKAPGYWFMNVTANEGYPPKLINGNKSPVSAGDGWVSGDWALVKVRLFAYDNEAKGVGCGLSAIQFLHKDEPLGGEGGSTDEGFDVVASATVPSPDDYDPFLDE